MSDIRNLVKMKELQDMFFYTFGIVPLQNYGVVGDGTTDNRLNIQQAIYDAIEIGAKYMTFIPIDPDMKSHMKEAYDKVFEKEKRYHQTLIGIHRDDILFELNENPVCEVASQGQKRSFVLALKLGLAQIIYEKSGQYPILLLDDVFSELDDFRKRQLIEKLPRDMQIFITTTERLNINWNREVRFYDIEKGRIKEALK